MAGDLLQTKLYIPPFRPNLIPRAKLLNQLNQGLHLGGKLTLVSAPAGFGKTTLITEWINQINEHNRKQQAASVKVAWVSLDQGDNDTARFFAYLVAALQKVDVAISQHLLTILETPQLPAIESIVTTLINDITTAPDPFLLVIDDFHTITNLVIHQAIDFLLEHQPPKMHLVIATRQDPSLSLSRLRGQRQVTEIRQTDLRFTPEETAIFLNQSKGLSLTVDEINALEARTEGWVVGLQLAAVSMRGREDTSAFIHAFTGSNRHILDYLVEEVLHQQPDQIQNFLLQTALLNRLSGPLCIAVTGQDDSQAILEQMERDNLFIIPLDDERKWYRYHHLFAELLQARLIETIPDQEPELHQQAAVWFEQNGFTSEAVFHSLAIENYAWATEVIETAIKKLSTWSSTDIATIINWLEALPESIIRTRPWLGLFASRALYVTGRWKEANRILQDLENLLLENPGIEDGQRLLGLVISDHASYSAVRGDVKQAIKYTNLVLADIPEEDTLSRIRPYSILGMTHIRAGDIAEAYRYFTQAVDSALAARGPLNFAAVPLILSMADIEATQGKLNQAHLTCKKALKLGTVGGVPIPVTGFTGVVLGRILYEWNDLEAAENSLNVGLERLNRGGIAENFGNMLALLALVKQAQGDDDSASSLIQQAVLEAKNGNILRLEILVSAFQARIWLAQGKLDAAVGWADEYQQIDPTQFLREFEDLTLARVLLANRQLEEALSLLGTLQPPAETAGRLGRVLEIHILRALAWQAFGDAEKALDSLKQAFALAEPEGYVRLFIDEGKPMIQLLQKVVRAGIATEYANLLLKAASTPEPSGSKPGQSDPSPLVEPLTEREFEILQHLAQGLSNPEIAEKLFLSPNTVRTHTYNLYGKLDVHSRMQAVTRAREIGLIPTS